MLDDFSRTIIAWKLCTTMKAEDVTDTLELALKASGRDRATVIHKPRLLSDNGSSYIAETPGLRVVDTFAPLGTSFGMIGVASDATQKAAVNRVGKLRAQVEIGIARRGAWVCSRRFGLILKRALGSKAVIPSIVVESLVDVTTQYPSGPRNGIPALRSRLVSEPSTCSETAVFHHFCRVGDIGAAMGFSTLGPNPQLGLRPG